VLMETIVRWLKEEKREQVKLIINADTQSGSIVSIALERVPLYTSRYAPYSVNYRKR